jgi:tRNA(Ile)-lysidine synthase
MGYRGIAPPAEFLDPNELLHLHPTETVPICVALSGGADSVALLAMLADRTALSAVHVHHGIRGEEADRDADFCRALTDRLGIPLTVLNIDAPALAKARGVSLETAARDGRYAVIEAHMR